MVPLPSVRALVDYRPALRAPTGIGEYVHELARALAESGEVEMTAFSASWQDRVSGAAAADLPRVRIVDRRVPVRALTWAWHHAGTPPVEWLSGACDVAHSPTPLAIPARRAARVVTVFDLHFLTADRDALTPVQRDFAALAPGHLRGADHVIAGSQHAADLVSKTLGIDPARVTTTPLGAPRWAANVAADRGTRAGSTILFIGTLEPRKNVALLLDAYAQLLARRPDAPPLVVAGAAPHGARAWVERMQAPPLAGHVRLEGYVSDERRRALFAEARMLALPSRDEGFGLPALEAMACGVPVVTTPVGALPEVVGDAGLVAPLDATEAWTSALEACLDDERCRDLAARGRARAERFTWANTAARTLTAYRAAIAARAARS